MPTIALLILVAQLREPQTFLTDFFSISIACRRAASPPIFMTYIYISVRLCTAYWKMWKFLLILRRSTDTNGRILIDIGSCVRGDHQYRMTRNIINTLDIIFVNWKLQKSETLFILLIHVPICIYFCFSCCNFAECVIFNWCCMFACCYTSPTAAGSEFYFASCLTMCWP